MLDEALFTLLFDAFFGVIQWALILRFIYGIFLPENSKLAGVHHLNRVTNPIIALFGFMTHNLIILRVRPLYVAFFILVIRFYILPVIFGYEIYGIQDLSLEALTLMGLGVNEICTAKNLWAYFDRHF